MRRPPPNAEQLATAVQETLISSRAPPESGNGGSTGVIKAREGPAATTGGCQIQPKDHLGLISPAVVALFCPQRSGRRKGRSGTVRDYIYQEKMNPSNQVE